MPFAWFWPVVVGVVKDILCHVHGFGRRGNNCEKCPMPIAWFWSVLARVVQDVRCHLHGFGWSWLEVRRKPYAIFLALACNFLTMFL